MFSVMLPEAELSAILPQYLTAPELFWITAEIYSRGPEEAPL